MAALALLGQDAARADRTPADETFDRLEFQALAARASSLDERLAGDFLPVTGDGRSAKAETGFAAWKTSAAGGDEPLLEALCRHRDLDLDRMAPLFGDVVLAPGLPQPQWIADFAWIFRALQRAPDAAAVALLANDQPLPYERLFYPLLLALRQRRDAQADPRWLETCSEEALADLDRALLKPFTDIFVRALNDKFNLRRYAASNGLGLLSFASGPSVQKSIEEEVEDFVEALREDGLKAFFVDRPVLARLLSRVAAQWQEATLEFLSRLHRDLPKEISELAAGRRPGLVTEIATGLSDLHNGGRSVYKVTFANGLKIGYKPKALGIDKAWASLLDWLAAEAAPAAAGRPEVRALDGYGWVEWLSPAPCKDEKEAREFFRRSGATLCLIRMLQGNDFHYENVMACGPKPVPVDLETVMRSRIKEEPAVSGPDEAIAEAMRRLDDSVYGTGYLPGWMPIPGGSAVLMGGLDLYEPLADKAAGGDEAEKPRQHSNVPSLNGVPLRVKDYEAELLAGYEAMFAFIAARGPEMAAPGGPLDAFDGVTYRPVLRATRIYGLLQQRALGRSAVIDGAAWSLHFDFLYQSSMSVDGPLPYAAVCAYERTAMADHNIPFFEGKTDSTAVICGDGRVVENFFRAPCLEEVRARFANPEPELLRRDLLLIEQALRVTLVKDTTPEGPALVRAPVPRPASGEELIAAARGLADSLERRAIRAGGAATWMGVAPVTGDERTLQPQPLAATLYTGTLGISLFYASLYRLTGEARYRTRALECVAVTLEQVEKPTQMNAMARLASYGLASGLGGLVYGLVSLSDLLKEPRLLAVAKDYALLVREERLADCNEYGLFGGIAGTMLALLALYGKDRDHEIAARIKTCGEQLLADRCKTRFEARAWRDRTWSLPQVGLMHGASGIALVLKRAAEALGVPTFAAAADEGLAYERALFDLCGGWPDLRDVKDWKAVEEAPCGMSYANGAAGIALSRLELAAAPGAALEMAEDVDRAVRRLRHAPLTDADEIFAGNIGILAALMTLARARQDEILTQEVASAMTRLLETAEDHGRFRWPVGEDGDNPCFFNGAAGVGLALLQQARPDEVPNLFALEVPK